MSLVEVAGDDDDELDDELESVDGAGLFLGADVLGTSLEAVSGATGRPVLLVSPWAPLVPVVPAFVFQLDSLPSGLACALLGQPLLWLLVFYSMELLSC